MRLSVRKSLYLFAVVSAIMVVLIGSTVPAGAVNASGGAGGTLVSPELNGKKNYNLLGQWLNTYDDKGFPCQGGGGPALHAVSQYLGGGASYGAWNDPANTDGHPDLNISNRSCHGILYGSPNAAAFSGSGYDTDLNTPFSFTGSGNISGAYVYSEPCQSVAGSPPEAATGEAIGRLILNVNGAGFIGTTPITLASVSVDFWWSRVGLTAVVGLRNITLSSTINNQTVTVSDPSSRGLATAVFVPTSPPSCTNVGKPAAGGINIFSDTISVS